MIAVQNSKISTWFLDETEEADMVDDHVYLWEHMLNCIPVRDYSALNVLDYGCNRGGFLEMLGRRSSFKHAYGIDVAEASLAHARQRLSKFPVTLGTPDILTQHKNDVDVAFSHEVIYLLSDLNAHAVQIAACLKDGGAYYAAIGCHTENPLWPMWHDLIAKTTNLPVYDYSLNDYAQAFWNAGLKVTMRPFNYPDFVLIKKNNAYFPSPADSLNYHSNIKTLICAKKI